MKRESIVLVCATLMAAAAHAGKRPAPVFDGLGNHHHPITASSKEAQRYFDQGLMLCYAFNHKEAIRSFRAAASLDPDCAMAYWGVAYAYGPHVNKPMTEEDTANAWKALQQALAAKAKGDAKEQAYIEALSKRYQEKHESDRSALDKAYAAAMRDVAKAYPDDLDAQVLLAEALMDTMPWDYWLKDRSPKPETEEALAAMRYVMSRYPNHPGATHMYIHAVEAGPHPEQAIPAADLLSNFAPDAGHLVHMPSHIYARVGRYHDAVVSNERAVKADKSYIRHCAAQGFYPGVYYPHNVHFLWFANMLEGRSVEALSAAHKVAQYAAELRCGPTQVLEAPRFRHLPWITLVKFGRWDEVLAVSEPASTNTFIMDRIMWHFARGVSSAAKKQADDAASELEAMKKLIHSDDAKALDNPHFPAGGVLQVAEHMLAGKVAAARGNSAEAITALQKAVEAEDALPYMEPPYWPFPTRPALGAAYLQSGDGARAEQTFRDDLKKLPRNGWGLFGLEQSLRQQNKAAAAESVQREFKQAWKNSDVPLQIAWY
jgi:tetratricopeptide (TPR) repeat protein